MDSIYRQHIVMTIVHDPDISAEDLNSDLNTIRSWAHQWKMSFNPEPSKQAVEIIFSQKKHLVPHPLFILTIM